MSNISESKEGVKWYQFKSVTKVFGIHIKYFLPLSFVVLVALMTGILPSDGFVRSIVVLMAVGGLMSWIGSVVPLIRSVGGKLLFPMFGTVILMKTGIFPETASESANLLMDNGFQMFFVASIVVGTILATDGKLLKASALRYLPILFLVQVFGLAFAFLSSLITGKSFYEAVFFIAAPCMAGGTSGAITTLPSLYSSVLQTDMSTMSGNLFATAMLGTYLALAISIVMKILASNFPKLMGNGQGELLKKESAEITEAKKNMTVYPNSTNDYGDLIGGLFLSLAVTVVGSILNYFVPNVVYIAWTIIIVILVKIFGLVPDELCKKANCWSQFTQEYLIIIICAGIGMSSSSGVSLSSIMSPATIITLLMTFAGAIIGAMVGAKIFGLHRYETAITAAMCSCNIGASGDVQMLALTERMDLLAFATISTRIGGAMMLIEISILFPIVVRALGL
ncbi:malate:Na+ symporter [Lachnospiraceae bacterium PM6-15]|uniref:2-hydroxycarboxylate transporter family protein n=1 Tax=Ohessyouella blattaphilus TaxID=2949333 RepID=UPI002562A106|nr:2-hydroxycarboxylate transporter family protein [Lachnospiraceae bacterium OttesenSCG-928-J05]